MEGFWLLPLQLDHVHCDELEDLNLVIPICVGIGCDDVGYDVEESSAD
jgi:hypothetical protein